ncbi:MAG: LapA family protein [Phycisphaerales bacterium]|nr:LapA family protein [Phycisphaerales bacterium]
MTKGKLKAITLVLVLIVALLLVVLNSATTEVRLIVAKIQMPLSLLLVCVFGLGTIAGVIVGMLLAPRAAKPNP